MPIKNPTRHKLQEAEYFLSKMEEVFENDDLFSYNLSAFLSAARSITFHMQKQYKHRDGFNNWYCQRRKEMCADCKLVYLNEARVEEIHREPVQTVATRQVDFTVDTIIANVDGTVPNVQARQLESTTDKSDSRTIRRFFREVSVSLGKRKFFLGDMDVIPFCKEQLCKLKMLVDEGEKCFA